MVAVEVVKVIVWVDAELAVLEDALENVRTNALLHVLLHVLEAVMVAQAVVLDAQVVAVILVVMLVKILAQAHVTPLAIIRAADSALEVALLQWHKFFKIYINNYFSNLRGKLNEKRIYY